MALVISNKVTYVGQLQIPPITTVSHNLIRSQFEFDAPPTTAELSFYDNGLTNSNVGGTLISTVRSITNQISNIQVPITTISGNYYYSDLLSEDGLIYKSSQVRLFPTLFSVTMLSSNINTDVILIGETSVSFPCNLKFTFYRTPSGSSEVEQVISPPLILPSTQTNYAVNRFDILSSNTYRVGIQAVDSANNVIDESAIRYSNQFTPGTGTPTVTPSPTVTLVKSDSYTVTSTTSVRTGVAISLFNRGSTNSNTGGTIVGAAIKFTASELTNTRTITLPGGTSINSVAYYYVTVQPTNFSGTPFGTAVSSATFRNPVVSAVTVSSISASAITVQFTRSIITHFRVLVYRNVVDSVTNGNLFDTSGVNVPTPGTSRTITISAPIGNDVYNYVIVQPTDSAGVETGTPGKSATFIYPKVLSASISFIGTGAYIASWTTSLPTRVRVTLSTNSGDIENNIFSIGVSPRTINKTLSRSLAYRITVQPLNAAGDVNGVALSSSYNTPIKAR